MTDSPAKHPLKVRLAARLIRAVVHLLGATYRVEVLAGEGVLDSLAEPLSQGQPARPVILSFWHNRVLFCAYRIVQRLLRRGYPVTILVSQSRDGDLGDEIARLWRARTVRGSATRGGSAGLRRLYRAVREGSAVVTIPDGPQGPPYRAKPGAVVLAQMSGVPILPMAWAARSFWCLKSWDRLIVPRPFTRIAFAVGEPITVPAELAEGELEERSRHLAAVLDDLTRRTEEHLGVRGPDLPWERWGLQPPQGS